MIPSLSHDSGLNDASEVKHWHSTSEARRTVPLAAAVTGRISRALRAGTGTVIRTAAGAVA